MRRQPRRGVEAKEDTHVGVVTLVLGHSTISSGGGVTTLVKKGSVVKPGIVLRPPVVGMFTSVSWTMPWSCATPKVGWWLRNISTTPPRCWTPEVRFKLETGVARAISGTAAESAKDRFRLNTPLVAIGVRGTDLL